MVGILCSECTVENDACVSFDFELYLSPSACINENGGLSGIGVWCISYNMSIFGTIKDYHC